MQEALDRAQGLVAYFDGRIADLTPGQVVRRGDLHADLRHWRDAFHDLAQLARLAIDAGVAERHVRVAERYGDLIGRLLEGILDELNLTAEQAERAPAIVQRHLKVLEGGQAA